jgi:hypothetical protein
MRNIRQLFVALIVTILAACGGGGTLDSDGGTGGGNTPVYSVAIALINSGGQASNQLSLTAPLTVTATLTATNNGSVANQVINFALDNTELAVLGNGGTALTNADGVATLALSVGSKAGAGSITASLNNSDATATTGFNSSGGGGAVDEAVGSVILLADKLQLGSGSNDKVQLSALVRSPTNVLLQDVRVSFSSEALDSGDGGELVVTAQNTEADGIAKAELSSAIDASIRDITVTASVGQVSSSLVIRIVGTDIDVSAPDSVVVSSSVQISVILRNAQNQPIANTPLQVSSSLGNALSTTTPVTNSTGQATFTYDATNSGQDTLTVSALGASSSVTIDVNADEFLLDTTAGQEVNLNTNFAVNLVWTKDDLPQANQAVTFITSRGGVFSNPAAPTTTVSEVTVNTDANGEATVYVRSALAGLASISAKAGTGDEVVAAQTQVEFIATTPATVEVQASPTQIGLGEQSSVRAIVRDSNNNPVKNRDVTFSLSGAAGGSILPASARTNSQGIASTVFEATSTTARDGVVVTASVGVVNGSTSLTVGERTLFFRIATGNTLQIPSESTYRKEFSVIVTDASGNPVPNQNVYVAANPTLGTNPTTSATWAYAKGFYTEFPDEPNFEYYVAVRTVECANEDANLNGSIDPGEDNNLDGTLTPGNVVTVPQTITSDENGIAVFHVTYGQSYANWIQVDLVVSDRAEGTENRTSQRFELPVSSTHVSTKGSPPPRNPFGSGNSCGDTL